MRTMRTSTRSAVFGIAFGAVLSGAASGVWAAEQSVSAPDTIDPGQELRVTIDGVVAGGRLELHGPIGTDVPAKVQDSASVNGPTAGLAAPGTAGSYELRYLGPDGAVLSKIVIDVAAAPVSLSIPTELSAGALADVTWRGPGATGDTLQIVDPASGEVRASTPAEGSPGIETVTAFGMPDVHGQHELRYVTADGTILRQLPVTLTPGGELLRTPIEVFVGEAFTVEWLGGLKNGHVFRVLDQSGTVLDETAPSGPETGPLTGVLQAPPKPGHYRIEFADPTSGAIATSLPLDVDPV